MKKTITLLAALLCVGAPLTPVHGAAISSGTSFSDMQLQAYQQQLLQEVANQEAFVTQMQAEMARKDVVHTQATEARYEMALTMLDVKRTLVSNFLNAQSLQSPVVRSLLLSILKQEVIMPSDLANLQSTVDIEKAKMQPVTPPTPAPTPVTPVTPTTPSTPMTQP